MKFFRFSSDFSCTPLRKSRSEFSQTVLQALFCAVTISYRPRTCKPTEQFPKARSKHCNRAFLNRSVPIPYSSFQSPFFLQFLIILAGFPAITTLSGKEPQTTLPAPTTTFFPKVVPFSIIEFAPIKQPSPITTGRFSRRSSRSVG